MYNIVLLNLTTMGPGGCNTRANGKILKIMVGL